MGADREDRAVQSGGLRRPAQPVQQIGLHQDGGHVIGIDLKRAIEARHAAFGIAGQIVRLVEVEPDRRRPRLDRRGPLQPVARAPPHRRH